ncbi:MAG TPA: ABC transporter permease [Candidatus Sulfotelmatobacter sp.]|nr:ABC transporter permease [Candidatus Sulfotelmatobacter sp.]
METLRHDIRYAARTLWKARGFALVAIVTLALGIGASTAIFSVMDNVLMEPFPYTDAQRLMTVLIHDTERNEPGGRGGYTGPEFLDIVEQNHVFDRVIANDQQDVLYRSGSSTELLKGSMGTPGTFEFLGMAPLIGRAMEPADYEPGAPPVFVMRYKTWVTKFSADPSILNKTYVLNDTPRTLIGVMPPRFGWGDADIYIPARPDRAGATEQHGFPQHWFLLGHLKPGVSEKQAQVDLDIVAHQIATKYPKEYPKHFVVEIQSLTDLVVGQFRTTLYIMLAAVGLLLLIGCGNVANLLLARATGREKEFAIRAVLGAGRMRLIRQLLVESLILALGGAALGTLIAWAGLKSLVAAIPQDIIPAEAVIRLNTPVLLFTLGVAILTALVFGLVPALQAARRDLNDPLRDSGKGTGGGGNNGRLRNAVVVLEVALSLTLMVGAGLLMRSFMALRDVHLGFQADHILVVRLPLPTDRYKTADQLMSFYKPLVQRLKALPGIVDATETSSLPPYGGNRTDVDVVGKSHAEKWQAMFQLSSDTYFSTLKLPFLSGRPFTEAEVNGKRKLAVVNQTFAKRYMHDENPIGQRVHIIGLETYPDAVKDAWFEVIGVVADAKNQGLQDPVFPEAWVPYTMTGSGGRGILARTAQEPMAMLKSVEQEVWATDRGVALTFTGTLESFINSFSYAGPRFGFLLMSIFGGIGLILVTVGVYSVLAYTAAQRTHEIGIRMALGAESSDVLKLVVSMGLQLVGIGAVSGVVASLLLASAIKSQLWGVSAHDPMTMVAVTALLLATGVVACWIPARRASRVDPLVALRYE